MPSAKILLAPEFFNTALKVKPPPKSINTPQSVLSWICFQFVTPATQRITAADKAITLSKLAILPSNPNAPARIGLIWLLKTQLNAIKTKIAKVIQRCLFIGMASNCWSKRILSFGLKTIYSVPIMIGIKIIMIGKPYHNQSAKVRCNCVATMLFGGLPTKVPIPPILALYAIPKSTNT